MTDSFRHLELKEDHAQRPLWVLPDGRIFLETFSPIYKHAYDFLIAIAEPTSRPEVIHEYALTVHSLYAAVSVGLPTETIISVLGRLSKHELDSSLVKMIRSSTENYGKVKLVLQRNRLYVESPDRAILDELLRHPDIAAAHDAAGAGGIITGRGRSDLAANAMATEMTTIDLAQAHEAKQGDADEDRPDAAAPERGAGDSRGTADMTDMAVRGANIIVTDGEEHAADTRTRECYHPVPYAANSAVGTLEDHDVDIFSFEIAPSQVSLHTYGLNGSPRAGVRGRLHLPPTCGVLGKTSDISGDPVGTTSTKAQAEKVKKLCLPEALNYPMLEEYDFRNDSVNANIPYELKPIVKHRPYQEKGLAKMFGNGRARSGIIVLPCGAGKSLTGISAAVRTRKSVLVLVTNAVSVDQWTFQFQQWTTIQEQNLGKFTSADKRWFKDDAGVMVCTYSMIAGSHRRSVESQRIFDAITGREWGLVLLDEVHVVPAEMFRKVVGIIKAHCKLGLTATLVREDERINDLNFLIGPKLYEANWLDLTREGHIANVRCCEVWCEMDKDFYAEYLRESQPNRRITLSVMNPEKFRACQFLVRYHEEVRGDKVIVFSDNIFALKEYAVRMNKFFVYGGTGHNERTMVLRQFKTSSTVNTVFLSKVGDNSLDIPEANVLIQISSHAGSRRQEAQRLGRILRAKPGQDPNEFNAFFYTLVTKDSQEMYFSTKRRRFLIDQGYSYQTITNLLGSGGAGEANLAFEHREDRLKLLAKLKSEQEALAGIEEDADSDGLPAKGGSRRRVAKLAEFTGNDAMYREVTVGTKAKRSGSTLQSMLKRRR